MRIFIVLVTVTIPSATMFPLSRNGVRCGLEDDVFAAVEEYHRQLNVASMTVDCGLVARAEDSMRKPNTFALAPGEHLFLRSLRAGDFTTHEKVLKNLEQLPKSKIKELSPVNYGCTEMWKMLVPSSGTFHSIIVCIYRTE
ncbi:hypothetical protein Q1695_007727 [Nippostrongylus brasiliensis]|nr:hypothetical protein Q1695_007727 [Nippostrongylus brasiliensis]